MASGAQLCERNLNRDPNKGLVEHVHVKPVIMACSHLADSFPLHTVRAG